MKTQPGTMEHYDAYVERLLGELDCRPNLDDLVWHYTSGDSLIKILACGTIYTTQVACLNDATEIRYSASLLRNALSKLLPELSGSHRIQSSSNFFLSFCKMMISCPITWASHTSFVASHRLEMT
jgi:hypothetical protein